MALPTMTREQAQRDLIPPRACLRLATRLIDYGGVLLNYAGERDAMGISSLGRVSQAGRREKKDRKQQNKTK